MFSGHSPAGSFQNNFGMEQDWRATEICWLFSYGTELQLLEATGRKNLNNLDNQRELMHVIEDIPVEEVGLGFFLRILVSTEHQCVLLQQKEISWRDSSRIDSSLFALVIRPTSSIEWEATETAKWNSLVGAII